MTRLCYRTNVNVDLIHEVQFSLIFTSLMLCPLKKTTSVKKFTETSAYANKTTLIQNVSRPMLLRNDCRLKL